MSGRRIHLTPEDRARIADADALCAANGRELLKNAAAGSVARKLVPVVRQAQVELAVKRWLAVKANWQFVTGGPFNGIRM